MNVLQSKCYLSPYTRYLINDDKGIFVHIGNGRWIKTKKDILTFLIENIKERNSVEEIINQGSDEYSKEYISELLKKLVENNMVNLDKEFMIENKIELEDIYIDLTNRCNLRCLHCSVSAGESLKKELSTDKIYKIIDNCCKLNPNRIILTGGEIFVRRDIEDIIKYVAKTFDGKITLMTNGVLIDEKRIELISKYVDEVSLSLDGYDEKTTDYIRGKGVFKKVMWVIDKLHEVNFNKISLSMVQTGLTENNVQDFENMCKKLKVKSMVRVFEPIGRGKENYEKLKTDDFTEENEVFTFEQINDMKKNIGSKCICNAGHRVLSVEPNGDVYPCEVFQQSDYKLGNMLEDSKIEKFDVINKVKTCIVDKIKECKDCNVRYFCSSGCPKSDTTTYYNEMLRKKKCTRVKDFYKKIVWES